MKIIRPATINDSVLTSTNVEELVAPTYNSGTTYAINDKTSIAGLAGLYTIYQSLQSANLNNTPSSSPTWWKNIGVVYGAYSSGTTYAALDRVQDNTNHFIYESLVSANLGNALTDATKWVKVSETNRWKMFDTSMSSQTTRPDTINVTLVSTQRIDSLALMDVDANTITVTMTDSVDGIVYNQTHNMVSDSGIIDWWSYFYEPIVRKYDLLVMDLPSYTSATIGIVLDNTGFDANCGTCVIGQQKIFGCTQYGASVGIQDYSRKERNTWGDYVIVERAFNKRAKFDIQIENNVIDEMQKILASYRATPIVYVGSDLYSSTWLFGFYKDFDIVIAYFNTSDCSIEIEGLT